MESDKLLVLVGGVGLIGFIYIWFLTDWGMGKRKGVGGDHEHHH